MAEGGSRGVGGGEMVRGQSHFFGGEGGRSHGAGEVTCEWTNCLWSRWVVWTLHVKLISDNT